jgi:hypothetical protein
MEYCANVLTRIMYNECNSPRKGRDITKAAYDIEKITLLNNSVNVM